MPCLGDYPDIKEKLSSIGRLVVVALHKFVFEDEGDRGNRMRLREFEGFDEDDAKNKSNKEKYVEKNLSGADLAVSLDYNTDNFFEHIYMNLRKGQLLCLRNVDDVDDEYDQYDDDDNSNNTIMHNNNKPTTTSAENVSKMCERVETLAGVSGSYHVNEQLIKEFYIERI